MALAHAESREAERKRARHPGWPLEHTPAPIQESSPQKSVAVNGSSFGLPERASVGDLATQAGDMSARDSTREHAAPTMQVNTPALPAASQQYPVLPQAAATAAAAAAATLHDLISSAQHKPPDSQNHASAAGATGKAMHQVECQQQQQQQRRRAGPVNQWRPGMPLTQQQLPLFAVKQQQHQYHNPLHQQQQHTGQIIAQQSWSTQQQLMVAAGAPSIGTMPPPVPRLRPAGDTASTPSAAATLQAASWSQQQQQHRGPLDPQEQAGVHSRHEEFQSTGPRTLNMPAMPVLLSSAPVHADINASPSTAVAPKAEDLSVASIAAAQPPVRGAEAECAAPRLLCTPGQQAMDQGTSQWLKLLSCMVDHQEGNLALELLLAGQLYKGQLTRVMPAEAAAAAAVASPAGAASNHGLSGHTHELSAADVAKLQGFAERRTNVCFLCAMPLPQHQLRSDQPMQATGSKGCSDVKHPQLSVQAEGTSAATASRAAAAAAAAAEKAAAEKAAGDVDTLNAPLAEEDLGQAQAQTTKQQQPGQHQQRLQQTISQQHDALLESLGDAVDCSINDGCCLLVHQACAEWTVKASIRSTDKQSLLPSPRQLLDSLHNACCGCHLKGATLRCAVHGCGRSFHLPCAQGMRAVLLQDGSCWCADHRNIMGQQEQQLMVGSARYQGEDNCLKIPGEFGVDVQLSSPLPTKPLGLNPSPSFAAALVLQQMRCSKGYDALLVHPDAETGMAGFDSSSGAGTSSQEASSTGRTYSTAHRRLLEAMPVGSSSALATSTLLQPVLTQHSQPAGLYNSTAEANRQFHEQQQQQQYSTYLHDSSAAPESRSGTTLLLRQLQQQSSHASRQPRQHNRQHEHPGPTRRSPKPSKGRPPLQAPPGKAKGGWNTLGLISAFALAQQQQEVQEEEQQQQQLSASYAVAASVAVSGPTVVVPRVRARKGAVAAHPTI